MSWSVVLTSRASRRFFWVEVREVFKSIEVCIAKSRSWVKTRFSDVMTEI